MPTRHHPETETLPLSNEHVADNLERVADLLEAQEDNPFRARAYRSAAETVRHLRRPVHAIIAAEGLAGLTDLPGIGGVLARSIEQLAYSGRLPILERLQGETDPEALLASVSGIGPELAARIHQQLGIGNLEELEQAAHDGRLSDVPGMGPKRLQAIRDSLAGRLANWRAARRQPAVPSTGRDELPTVDELLDVDRQYRSQLDTDRLPRIAPRRFNPTGRAWLPVLHTSRGPRKYTALFSNTAQAHKLNATRDWVVLYWRQKGHENQCTVVTARSGPLRGRRVVRGREAECAACYAIKN